MSRAEAIARSTRYFDDGGFVDDLGRRVGYRTESQEQGRDDQMHAYLTDEIGQQLKRLGGDWRLLDNPEPGRPPFLIGWRHEADGIPTVLTYGHGDVVRGYDDQWRAGAGPWRVEIDGERLYGRGTADNKGQHLINLRSLESVLETRGKLGFNLKVLIEMGEETGSPGLAAVAQAEQEALAADVLIASDGPRLAADKPTLFLGARGVTGFDLVCNLRDGAHHSGNWGGLLPNPGIILANAIASIVDGRGVIQVPGLRPPPVPETVKAALAPLTVGEGEDMPEIDPDWGEPGLTPPERVFAWNSFEVLAFKTGNPERPANAIPPTASARCQIRFVVGSDWANFTTHIRDHLDKHGFPMVEVRGTGDPVMHATRLDPADPWVRFAAASIVDTTDKAPAILPNLGGSLPNDVFASIIGMPTVWVPHSYAGCSQHAPDEHILMPVARQSLEIMTGLFWDLGEHGWPPGATHAR